MGATGLRAGFLIFGQNSPHVPPTEENRSVPRPSGFSQRQGQRGPSVGQASCSQLPFFVKHAYHRVYAIIRCYNLLKDPALISHFVDQFLCLFDILLPGSTEAFVKVNQLIFTHILLKRKRFIHAEKSSCILPG